MTPACAGSGRHRCRHPGRQWDDPRVCGERSALKIIAYRYHGHKLAQAFLLIA